MYTDRTIVFHLLAIIGGAVIGGLLVPRDEMFGGVFLGALIGEFLAAVVFVLRERRAK